MKRDQTSRLPRPISPALPATLPTTGPPSLWHHLDPSRRQQLAQHMAELIRRLPLNDGRPSEEAPHEPV